MKNIMGIFRGIAFRLSLWYAVMLVMLFAGSFLLFFPWVGQRLDKQSDKELRDELGEYVGLYHAQGEGALSETLTREAWGLGIDNVFQSILTLEGRVITTSDPRYWKKFPLQKEILKKASGQEEPITMTMRVPGLQHKVKAGYAKLNSQRILRVVMSMRQEEKFLFSLSKILIGIMAVILGTVLLLGWFLLHQAMRRVVAVTGTALSISSGSLSRRVPFTSSGDEMDQLARAFNGMLDRIEKLVKGQQEITDNVAHDLKMPLTQIRLTAEAMVTAPPRQTELPKIAGTIVEESDRLLEMINTTLEIKAIETGIAVWDFQATDLTKLVQKAVELFQIVAEDKGLTLKITDFSRCIVKGEERRLLRAVSHLIDNAIKYTPSGGQIEISLKLRDQAVLLTVRDTGSGIAPEILPRIFDRFYRGDSSRGVSGLGLGLSLADSIIRAHGGQITVESIVGAGSTFTVILPFLPGN
jgi:signal transduction histidine kinase